MTNHAENQKISLAELGMAEDRGSEWHPASLAPGELLPDISDEEMTVHLTKEERANQPDAKHILSCGGQGGNGGGSL